MRALLAICSVFLLLTLAAYIDGAIYGTLQPSFDLRNVLMRYIFAVLAGTLLAYREED